MAMQAVTDEVSTISEGDVRQIRLNLEGVQTEFEPLPVGMYDAEVNKVEYVAKSKSGHPYLKVTFTITDAEHQDRRVFSNYSLKPSALWKFAKFATALGIELPDGELALDLDDLEGLPCVLSVGVEEYEGKLKNPVLDVLPVED